MLVGEKTLIRPLEINDLDDLYDWYNESNFTYWVCGNWPLASLLRRDYIENNFYENDDYRYSILDMDKNLIGSIGFEQVNTPARSAKLYIGIGKSEYWGKGYGYDAMNTFINYLFNQWNFRRLTVETWEKNIRAIKCYEKLGFVIEGKLRQAYYVTGKYYDAIIMGLLKSDFYAKAKS
ncbi:MAG: GNAT family N-acetyltransferase [Peptococcaceae bacterium]|nr:GNAT family N-acetyltransferase [Peptococcaceae bacterium]